jgi:hypothetical protein
MGDMVMFEYYRSMRGKVVADDCGGLARVDGSRMHVIECGSMTWDIVEAIAVALFGLLDFGLLG